MTSSYPWNTGSMKTYLPPWIIHDKDEHIQHPPVPSSSSSSSTSAAAENQDDVPDSEERGAHALQWLIAPFSVDAFEKDYREQQPLYIDRSDQRDYYQDVFASKWIKQWLEEGKLSFASDIDVTQYKDYKRYTLNGEGVAPLKETWKRFTDEKCSLRLVCPHSHSETLLNLLSTLEEYFGMFVGSNVYLTPPASQGFAPHYDDIDAYILQVEGSKHWRVYNPRSQEEVLPRYSSRNFDQEEIGEPILEKTLHPGDMLYMPRGFIHQAYTSGDNHSLHVTISTGMQFSWYNFFEKSLPAALHHAAGEIVQLRQSLPRGFQRHLGVINSDSEGDQIRETLVNNIMEKARTIVEYLPVDAAADQMARKFLRERLPPQLPPNVLGQVRKCQKVLRDTVGGKEPDPMEEQDINSITSNLLSPMEGKFVRLIHPECIRLVLDNDENAGGGEFATVYHCVHNDRRYMEGDEGSLLIPMNAAPTVEELIRTFPAWLDLDDMPYMDEEEEEGQDEEQRDADGSMHQQLSSGEEKGRAAVRTTIAGLLAVGAVVLKC